MSRGRCLPILTPFREYVKVHHWGQPWLTPRPSSCPHQQPGGEARATPETGCRSYLLRRGRHCPHLISAGGGAQHYRGASHCMVLLRDEHPRTIPDSHVSTLLSLQIKEKGCRLTYDQSGPLLFLYLEKQKA